MSEIAKCACGSEAVRSCTDDARIWWVECNGGAATGESCWLGPDRPTEAEAIAAWNALMGERALADRLAAALDEAQSIVGGVAEHGAAIVLESDEAQREGFVSDPAFVTKLNEAWREVGRATFSAVLKHAEPALAAHAARRGTT